jgi:hypothetical protein
MGAKYWKPLIYFLERMAEDGTIAEADLELFLVTDSIDEAVAHVDKYATEKFRLKRRKPPKPSPWLGEGRC